MTATEVPGTCAEHDDRPAVGTCGRCGRTVCVECAIPFHGALRCESCAAIELGDPAPPPAARRRLLGLERISLLLLVIGLLASIPPWHRSGTLTSVFSAWRPVPDPWSMVASALVAAAGVLCALALRRRRASRAWALSWALLALVAALTVVLDLMNAPNFFRVTAAPAVMATAATLAGVLGMVRARRLRL